MRPLLRHTPNPAVCNRIGQNLRRQFDREYIGGDPMAFDQTRTIGCSVYIDGVFSYGDYASDGDHNNVNCLRTLADDYYPNGVQGRPR